MAINLQRPRRRAGDNRSRLANGARHSRAEARAMSDQPWQPPQSVAWSQAIREPHLALDWSLAEWERVVRLARRLRLLARLGESLAAADLLGRVPVQARRHVIAELRLSRWRTASIAWTLERIAAALEDAPYPRVLLKGAAYIGQDLPIAAGRLPSDLDILVPRANVADAQERLTRAGWSEPDLDPHDRRYYHEWSHEVPPMTHALFTVELDLHHNILPPVARTRVDANALLEYLRPSKWAPWQVLDPVDQVLHSAAHLFLDSEARDRLRDLVDMDGLFRHFGAEEGFWRRLPERARTLGLTEPLALACHFCIKWIGSEVPAETLKSVAADGPTPWRRVWLQRLFEAILMPTEPDDIPPLKQDLAASVQLARYHAQRMPMRLLAPHLWRKLNAGSRLGREADRNVVGR
ncbi:MAG: nucleotidyltransferase family protein [Burkholderiaceae bacterium]